jgi:hypothetical protein
MAAWNSNGLTVRLVAGTTDTIQFTDDVVVFTGTGAKAVALPAASNPSLQLGKVYHITNANTGAITLTPASGQIDGAATSPLTAGGTTVSARRIVSDGTMWRTIGYTAGS